MGYSYEGHNKDWDYDETPNPCSEILMEASPKSIEDMVQNSAKYKPKDVVQIRQEYRRPIEEVDINDYKYIVHSVKWTDDGIRYTLEKMGTILDPTVPESVIEMIPMYQRRSLNL